MRVAIDIGGTFTDLYALTDEGKVVFEKTHTTPPHFEKGAVNAIDKSGIDPKSIESFIHGTTTVINALTERKGAKSGLITTRGFRDVLEIARANRPDLFNLVFAKPRPFIERACRTEVDERIAYDGSVLEELSLESVDKAIETLKKENVEAIAVCLINSYANDAHELEVVKRVKEKWPEVYITASVDVTREWREYERTSTAALNAYVMPTASRYVDSLENELDSIGCDAHKYIMQSNGGTTTFEASKITPINMVESGPVAGVFGSAILGKLIGEPNIIAYDVGGTTAKCSLIDEGEVKITTEYRIERTDSYAGYPIMTPVVDIVEIGNGGGSIAWIDSVGSLRVGPESAGADPGPVAYGIGGTRPTTTDAALVTGRLSAKNFDHKVDMDSVRAAIKEQIADPLDLTVDEAAMAIIRVADANMQNALKLISVRRGYDPRDFAMVAFGGGGPMHAAHLGRELKVKETIVPPAASVFSAWGMLMTDLRNDYIMTRITPLESVDIDNLNSIWDSLIDDANARFKEQDIDIDGVSYQFMVDMRYEGQEHTVKLPVPQGKWDESTIEKVISDFHVAHEQAYTFSLKDTPTEIVNFHLIAFGGLETAAIEKIPEHEGDLQDILLEKRDVNFANEGVVNTAVYPREKLGAGFEVEGPVIVEEETASTVVLPGQKVAVDEYGNLRISEVE